MFPRIIFIFSASFLLPRISNAAKVNNLGDLFNLLKEIISDSLIPLIVAIALAVFTWGIVQYLINADNEEKRKEGRKFMIWGILALFVMISVWALVAVLTETFGFDVNVIPQLAEPVKVGYLLHSGSFLL